MLITYHVNTNQLRHSSRVVIDHDATLDPATTIMFCKIHEQNLRTMIFRNDGTIIKTPQTPKTLIKKLFTPHGDLGAVLIDGIVNHLYQTSHPADHGQRMPDFPRSWNDTPSRLLGLLKQISDSQGKPVPLHGRCPGIRH